APYELSTSRPLVWVSGALDPHHRHIDRSRRAGEGPGRRRGKAQTPARSSTPGGRSLQERGRGAAAASGSSAARGGEAARAGGGELQARLASRRGMLEASESGS